jgi:Mlc titration factor MtfA (ptsG expression regulator)
LDFEKRVQGFLKIVRIKGVETAIEDMDRVFVAAAAIIPIFAFKDWEYRNIHDVLVYPNSFNEKYATEGYGRDVLGMVGEGAMQNLMILSKQDLRDGFLNAQTKSNAGIHEFVHLVDKEDGYTDGNPENLLVHKYAVPWLKQIHKEIELIQKGKSDINPYGATNEAEFLAVTSEYFFKQPELMQRKHPELFSLLRQIFSK